MVNLGDEVRDRVSGFKGIAVAKTEWLYGCARISVQSKIKKDGKIEDLIAFDELQLEVLKSKVVDSAKKTERKTGGPRPNVSQAQTPRRF